MTAPRAWKGRKPPDKISRPGAYDGIPLKTYLGDCCAGPSISHSGAALLNAKCPAKFWRDSYFNPNRRQKHAKEFDLGAAADLALTEPDQWGDRVVVIRAPNYKRPHAQDARDAAHRAGRIPLLLYERNQILALRKALLADPVARKGFLDPGHAQRSYFAIDPETGVWLKSRPDRVAADGSWVLDYKCWVSARKADVARRCEGEDFDEYGAAAWDLDTIRLATGQTPAFRLVVQELKPPHLVMVYNLDPDDIEAARMWNRRAIDLFARCAAENDWPGYLEPGETRTRAVNISMSSWRRQQIENERLDGAYRRLKPTEAMHRMAAAAQAPLSAGASAKAGLGGVPLAIAFKE